MATLKTLLREIDERSIVAVWQCIGKLLHLLSLVFVRFTFDHRTYNKPLFGQMSLAAKSFYSVQTGC